MSVLSPEDVERRLRTVHGWTLSGQAIVKVFTFKDFPDAVHFVERIVPVAEGADPHPDILINYRRVTLTYSTHSAGGLTEKDFDGALAVDRLA